MTITYETFTKPGYTAPDYLRFHHRQASSNPQQAVESVWDMTIPARPRLIELEEQSKRLATVRATAHEVPDLRALISTIEDPEELSAAVDQAAMAHARKLYLENSAHSANHIQSQLREERKGAGQFDHILDSIPLDEVEADFIDAARALGDAAFSAEQSLDLDAEALRTLTENGKKLTILTHLTRVGNQSGREISFTRNLGIFTSLPTLPDLPVQRAPLTGTEPLYTPEDRKPHDVVQTAQATAHRNLGVYLVALAQGKYPDLTLRVVRSRKELTSRQEVADRAGRERLTMGPGRTIPMQDDGKRTKFRTF